MWSRLSKRRPTFLTTSSPREGRAVRKKIPTITRPDPAYAASLRPEVGKDPGREEVRRAETMAEAANVEPVVLDGHAVSPPSTQPAPSPQPRQETAGRAASGAIVSPTRQRRSPATRKIDIRVNALERQEEALIDCGIDPAHVIRAALRRPLRTGSLVLSSSHRRKNNARGSPNGAHGPRWQSMRAL